jgi:hypothetical protein
MAQADASTPSSPRRTRSDVLGGIGSAVLVLALLVGSFLAWYSQSPPETVARQYLAEQGIQTGDLELVGRNSYSPFTPAIMSSITVEFRVKGAEGSKKRSVEVFRSVYFLPWRVSGYKEVDK